MLEWLTEAMRAIFESGWVVGFKMGGKSVLRWNEKSLRVVNSGFLTMEATKIVSRRKLAHTHDMG